jgi:addiction module RelE/StbE family toxin
MAKIKWGKRAVNDLKAIHNYIFPDSQFYADRYIDKLLSRVDQLESQSKLGRIVPEKGDSTVRELIEGNYRIFYRVYKNDVFILRIHHAARNIK